MDLGLRSKIAMVGGASKGLGYAVARALAADGAHVSIASRDRPAVEQAADTLSRETGSPVIGVAADLSRADAIERWHATTVDRFGGVDLLFANTGGPPAGTALAFDDGAWQAAFDLLLLSVVRTVRLVVPSMRARGGGAILVGTSSTVKEPFPNLALSNVMRAGVTALVKTLAGELAPDRIRVNTLLPGRIATDRLTYLDEANAKKAGITTDAQRERALSTIPMGRYGDPDEFGRAGAFLLSDAAAYVTGAALQVDGGMIRGLF
ncbi:MAG TPA: SDR family oxidoreductase [Vicinamibacterales bacterium]|nr:SDR family oxidoreductase [Vicinamibacterales bacterium]